MIRCYLKVATTHSLTLSLPLFNTHTHLYITYTHSTHTDIHSGSQVNTHIKAHTQTHLRHKICSYSNVKPDRAFYLDFEMLSDAVGYNFVYTLPLSQSKHILPKTYRNGKPVRMQSVSVDLCLILRLNEHGISESVTTLSRSTFVHAERHGHFMSRVLKNRIETQSNSVTTIMSITTNSRL